MNVEEGEKLTSFAETKKGIPHERIELQGLGVAFYSLRQILLSLPQFTLQAQNCSCIWRMLTARFAMFIYVMSVSDPIIRPLCTHSNCSWQPRDFDSDPTRRRLPYISPSQDMPAHVHMNIQGVFRENLRPYYTPKRPWVDHSTNGIARGDMLLQRTWVRRHEDDRRERAHF